MVCGPVRSVRAGRLLVGCETTRVQRSSHRCCIPRSAYTGLGDRSFLGASLREVRSGSRTARRSARVRQACDCCGKNRGRFFFFSAKAPLLKPPFEHRGADGGLIINTLACFFVCSLSFRRHDGRLSRGRRACASPPGKRPVSVPSHVCRLTLARGLHRGRRRTRDPPSAREAQIARSASAGMRAA